MQLRNLGRSGLRVSVVGLGCNNFGGRADAEASRRVVDSAIDHGITLFDTADVYGNQGGSETLLGEILGARRKDIVLATKFAMPMDKSGRLAGGSRRYVMEAVEASLRRLKTDWIDLYQLHRVDPMTPIEETLRALDDLVRQGKVRYIGCSNLPAWRVVEAQWSARAGGLESFVSVQDHYNILARGIEAELVPAVQAYGLGILPYYPLANGLLTGKYRRGADPQPGTRITLRSDLKERLLSDETLTVVEQLEAFATQRGHTLLELAFSWLACRPGVASVIAGAMRPEQVEANAAAAGWALTAEDMDAIDRICGHGAS